MREHFSEKETGKRKSSARQLRVTNVFAPLQLDSFGGRAAQSRVSFLLVACVNAVAVVTDVFRASLKSLVFIPQPNPIGPQLPLALMPQCTLWESSLCAGFHPLP